MIIANIIGGLGNQMFQYAAARALSIRRRVPLKLDISDFSSYNLHQGFELARIFNCTIDIAGIGDLKEVLGWQASPLVRRLLYRYKKTALNSKRLVFEPSLRYWEDIDEVSGDCYLKGYWQSEKYFLNEAEQIRSDFNFRKNLNKLNADVASIILQVNAVSVHVRRGDYASDVRTSATHGLCSLDYYRAALQYVTQHIPNPHLFIFSDDIPWVKKNIKLDIPSCFVNHNHGIESFNDMRLMSMCDHHIIANSSFSWWGAWLNPSRSKIVVAPKQWFKASIMNSEDICPPEWVKIDSIYQ